MKLNHPSAFINIPSGISVEKALARTTHLSIGAHPDDLEFMSLHGISACYQKKNQFFTGVVVTDGGGSVKSGPYAKLTPQEMIQARIREQKKAARIGKYNALIMLQYESSALKTKTPILQRPWIQDIQNLLQRSRPQTIYSHNPFDKHPTHLAVIFPLIQFLQTLPPARKPRHFFACEVWRGLDWVLDQDRVALPLIKTESLSEKLNRVFISQIGAGKNYAEATRGRRIANATFTDPHSTDPAAQLELALDLAPLLRQRPSQILPYLQKITARFEKELLANARKMISTR